MIATANERTTRVTIPVGVVREALKGFTKLGLRRARLPVLGMIRVQNGGDGIELIASDLDHHLIYSTEGHLTGGADVLVPYEKLAAAVRKMPAHARICIEGRREDGIITIDDGRLKSTVGYTSQPVDDFPEVPTVGRECIQLDESWMSHILCARQYASVDVNRAILNGILLEQAGVVATDGRRLFHGKPDHREISEPLILPAWKGLDLFTGSPAALSLPEYSGANTTRYAELHQGNWRWRFKPVEGNYPNWRQVLPSPDLWTSRITFSEDDVSLIERMAALDFTTQENAPITLQADEAGVRLVNGEGPHQEVRRLAPASHENQGRPEAVQFNFTFLLTAVRGGILTVQWRDGLSPVLATSAGRTALFMPLRGDAGKKAPEEEPEKE